MGALMAKTIAYIRCSTEEQADSRAGLEAQRAAILAEAKRRGWDEADVTFIEDAGFSGKNLDRPRIETALDALRHRKADTLVVSKLDRLSRSLVDFAGLMDRASREHWALIALELNVDTSTPAGGSHGCDVGDLRPVRTATHRREDEVRAGSQEGGRSPPRAAPPH